MPIIDLAYGQNKAQWEVQVANAIHQNGEAIDGKEGQLEDEGMSEVTFTSPRRSTRVFRRLPVKASGKDHNGRKFREACETVVVNAHGALLLLKHEIDDGVMIVIENPITMEEQECRVVYLGEPSDKGQRVGVEFLTPAPHFWGVEFDEGSPSGSDATH